MHRNHFEHQSHDHPFAADEAVGDPFGRRRFNRGPGFDGPPFGGPPFGGRGGFGRGGRGRVRRGQIRTALLGLLADESMHGYEMIRRIEESSGGRWKPSPGAVYPTLQQLTDEGLVTVQEDGGKRVFSLTDDGRAALEGLSDEDREPWTADGDVHPMWELKPLIRQLAVAASSVLSGTPDQAERGKAVLTDARRKLYAILAEEPDGSDGSDVPTQE